LFTKIEGNAHAQKHPGFALQVVVDLSQFAAGLTTSGRDGITEEIQ
jgi:hypothetical protein